MKDVAQQPEVSRLREAPRWLWRKSRPPDTHGPVLMTIPRGGQSRSGHAIGDVAQATKGCGMTELPWSQPVRRAGWRDR